MYILLHMIHLGLFCFPFIILLDYKKGLSLKTCVLYIILFYLLFFLLPSILRLFSLAGVLLIPVYIFTFLLIQHFNKPEPTPQQKDTYKQDPKIQE